jgi:hypothetical protein
MSKVEKSVSTMGITTTQQRPRVLLAEDNTLMRQVVGGL